MIVFTSEASKLRCCAVAFLVSFSETPQNLNLCSNVETSILTLRRVGVFSLARHSPFFYQGLHASQAGDLDIRDPYLGAFVSGANFEGWCRVAACLQLDVKRGRSREKGLKKSSNLGTVADRHANNGT